MTSHKLKNSFISTWLCRVSVCSYRIAKPTATDRIHPGLMDAGFEPTAHVALMTALRHSPSSKRQNWMPLQRLALYGVECRSKGKPMSMCGCFSRLSCVLVPSFNDHRYKSTMSPLPAAHQHSLSYAISKQDDNQRQDGCDGSD